MGLSDRKILICGLPGSGKTTLTASLAPLIRAVVFNGDDVRKHCSRDLGFSLEDRLEQSMRMRWLCERVAIAGYYVIADFVCPTELTRAAFGPCFTVFVDRIQKSRFADTNAIYEPPISVDVRVTAEGSPDAWASQIARVLAAK